MDSPSIQLKTPILITGAAGFIGARVVDILLGKGFSELRCFVRPSSRTARLQKIIAAHPAGNRVQIISGDLLSRDDCKRAVEGVSIIYHLAAGVEKSFAGAFMNSALATRNLIEAFLQHGTRKRFVNVSSFAVYSNLHLDRGAVLDESCPLENASQQRFDPYGFGKLKQDEIVTSYGKSHQLPYVIMRPGSVFGPGKPALTGRVGIDTFGFFVHMGGSNQLPLTYVDNCAEAIVLAGVTPGVDGEVFNIVDDDLPTSRQFLRAYRQRGKRMFSFPLPYFAASAMCRLWEKYSMSSRGQLPPVFNRRRCAAEWKGNRYTNRKLKEKLGWKPRVPMDQAMTLFLEQFKESED